MRSALFLTILALFPTQALADPGDLSAYLRARVADADGRSEVAAHEYAAALAAAPDNPLVAIRAYREALAVGDDALVDRAASVLAHAGVAPGDAALQALAVAARARDLPAMRNAIVDLAQGPLAPITAPLDALVASVDGRDPFAILDAARADPIARRFAAETRALLLIERGQTAEGLAAVRALTGATNDGVDLRVDAAEALIAQGHGEAARGLLAGDEPALARLGDRSGGGEAPALGHDVSRLLTRLGVSVAGGDPSPLVIALARAALRADPRNDRARLLLADELRRSGAPARALAVLDAVDPSGPYVGMAQSARVAVLANAGDTGAALAAARTLASRPDAASPDIDRFGEQLLAAGRADEAAAQYRRLVDRPSAAHDGWMQYGSALDQAHRWPEARAALERAVALNPDDPIALNALGYARIEHHEAIASSRAMLERAARLKPGDPAITDSLAWAYVRRGEVRRALPMLEAAVEGEPGSATIAEHLGDARWAAGQRFEARYAWHAASLVAEAGDAPRLTAKIARGLGRR